MPHTLPPLPYDKDALAPHISAETLTYHHEKHHQAYVIKLNALIADTPHADATLETLIKTTDGAIFNNAAQVWNHTFYWNSLSPQGGGDPEGALAAAIVDRFGSVETFKAEFSAAGLAQFGSGWVWLVKTSAGSLDIIKTANADNPLTQGHHPLLTCDVWEHAYYIDTRNNRGEYLNRFWALANWAFAANQFANA